MTFSSNVREELAHLQIGRSCCRIAYLAAALRGAGTLHLTGQGHVHAELDVGSHAVARQILVALRSVGATCGVQAYTPERLGATQRVLIVLAEDAATVAVLQQTRVIDEAGRLLLTIDPAIVQRNCCGVAALQGAFAVGGSVTPPGKAPLLEIRTHGVDFAKLLQSCAARIDVHLRLRERPRWCEVMTRRRSVVQDMLTVMGVESAALDVAEDDVLRSARADANRRANFDTANLTRQVAAARSQVAAITSLIAAGQLEHLPEHLRETAEVRLECPDLTLSELSERTGVARPTVAARLRRIVELADMLAAADQPRRQRA